MIGLPGLDVRTIFAKIRTMKRTNIHLSDAQRNWLQRHGQAVGKHPAAIVREAIDYYRETNERHAQRRAKALTRECRKSDR